MDLGLIFGLLGTWVLVFWAVFAGGETGIFVDIPSIILVMGASITIMFCAYPVSNLKRIVSVLKACLSPKGHDLNVLVEQMVSFAEIARRDGILSLENALAEIEDPFMVRAVQMAVDGADPQMIEQVLDEELDHLADRHSKAKEMLDGLGKYAPAFGMIGTLVGLVAMLANMDDPSAIGAGMAVALLTTLYGALIANGVALPLADRLGRRSEEEQLYKSLIIRGVMAIQSGDNPRTVEQRLRSSLPPAVNRSAASTTS